MDFTKKQQIVILVMALLIAFSFVFKFLIKDKLMANDKKIVIEDPFLLDESSKEFEPQVKEAKKIMVQISGQVYFPGVVEIQEGKRLIDAVDICGGLKEDADINRVNLAKILYDEDMVYIPKVGEEVAQEVMTVSAAKTSSSPSKDGLIDINTCSKGDLLSLPGIGDVLADRIIAYREDKPFTKIEDIKEVSGIGDKKYNGICELINVR